MKGLRSKKMVKEKKKRADVKPPPQETNRKDDVLTTQEAICLACGDTGTNTLANGSKCFCQCQ